MGDATIVVEQGFNGDTLLRHTRTIGGGPNMVIRMSGPDTPQAREQALRGTKADFARLAIALLLRSTDAAPVEFSYAGRAESPDGSADVLDAKGPGSFAARLFLDATTHRPLMLTYRGVAPRIVMRTEQRGHDAPPTPNADEPAAGAPPAPEVVDIAMYLDDYKQVDGIWLPHHISRSIAGKPSEEWTFKQITVNPTFKPDTFSAK
jgi:hypothetical protein